jgi:hypothetical protein
MNANRKSEVNVAYSCIPIKEEIQLNGNLEEDLRNVLSYLASETMKARKSGKTDRAEKLSVAFKILSEEYDKISSPKEEEAEK